MTFYTALIILTELLMIAMTLHVMHYSGFTKEQKAWFLVTFIAIMLCSGAEFAVHCGYYDPIFKIPLTILTVLQFSVAPLLGVLFVGALGLKHQKNIAIGYFLVNLTVEVVSAPFGWVFRFDQSGYLRGPFFILYEAFYFISLVYLIISMIMVGRKFRHRDGRTIAMILVVLVAGILPMTVFSLNITYIAIAISSSLCYIYYNDLVQQDIKAELVSHQEKMSDMQSRIIFGLASLIEDRDLETGEHVSRTSTYAKTLAEDAIKDGVYADVLDKEFVSKMYALAPLHDIGKIVVSDVILRKPARLTAEEFEQIKKHAPAGGKIVREVLNGIAIEEYLSFAEDIATCHHERWDGTGYPYQLSGENIPLSARIMAIADVFDALTSKRCYKDAISPEEAFEILKKESGTHFDPNLITVFLRHKEDFIIT